MTLATARDRNDLLRTKFEGGKVVVTATVYHIDPQIRGRALYRLTLYDRFSGEKDDHSEGAFVFAGYFWVWKIEDFAGEGARLSTRGTVRSPACVPAWSRKLMNALPVVRFRSVWAAK
jgi:hypothetical protein